MCPADQIEVLFPMDQVSLSNCLLAQGQYVKVVIFTHCCIEIELAFDIILIHHWIVIFMSNLFIYKIVSLVFFSIWTNITCILWLNPCEIIDFSLFLFCLGVATDFSPTNLIRFVACREATRGEVLRVENTDLSLVAKDEEQTLRQEKALIDRFWLVTDVEPVKFDLWIL